ncbi:MAG: hypothetical protein Q4F54_03965 [Coriobacteriia bacterium]|nr:hypothetical protein [Coriobacteriia bacterium]
MVTATAKENGGPAINVGEYTDTDDNLTYEWAAGNASTLLSNYNIPEISGGKLAITKKNASFVSIAGSVNYDDNTPFAKSFVLNNKTATGIIEGDTFNVEFTTYDNDSKSGAIGDYVYGAEATGKHLVKTSADEGVALNYNMTYAGKLTINPRSIDPSENPDITWEKTNPVYDGNDNRELQTLVINDKGSALTVGTDYSVSYPDATRRNVKPEYEQKYKAVITGLNNYAGSSFTVTWNIDPAPINVEYGTKTHEFDGKPYEDVIDITAAHGLISPDVLKARIVTYKDTTKCGDVGVYTMQLSNDDSHNIAFVKLSDTDQGVTTRNYKLLTFTGQVEITKRTFDPSKILVTPANPTYNGQEQFPVLTVKDTGLTPQATLVLGKDFEITSGSETN